MSKQPRSARDYIESLRAKGLLVPTAPGDPRQTWILVRRDPGDNHPGAFFVSHAFNLAKFTKRPGFEILGWSHDRIALTLAARRATEACGPAYAPRIKSPSKGGPTAYDPNAPDLYDEVQSPLLDVDPSLVLDDDPDRHD